jgi:L-fuconolactonase
VIIDAHHHLWTADYAWLQDPALGRIRRDYTVAAAGLVNELVVRASQLPSVARAAAACPNVTAKLSGLVSEANW